MMEALLFDPTMFSYFSAASSLPLHFMPPTPHHTNSTHRPIVCLAAAPPILRPSPLLSLPPSFVRFPAELRQMQSVSIATDGATLARSLALDRRTRTDGVRQAGRQAASQAGILRQLSVLYVGVSLQVVQSVGRCVNYRRQTQNCY